MRVGRDEIIKFSVFIISSLHRHKAECLSLDFLMVDLVVHLKKIILGNTFKSNPSSLVK